MIKAHAKDPRVLWWGLFNEPHKSGFSLQLRRAAYGWAKAINPIQPISSCWDKLSEPGNNDSDLQNIHHYNADFKSLTTASWHGLTFLPPQGSVITEAGCRWFQGESGSSGSPLEMLNWLAAMKAESDTPYMPGVMLSWTVIVGNDNTRWHWGSKQGTPEPAIPWCGLMWPDGLPVSYTEAHAIAAHTGVLPKQGQAAMAGDGPLPKQLWSETFLPQSLDELRSGSYGSTYLSIGGDGSSKPIAVDFNSTVPVVDDVLIELTLWPTWTNTTRTSKTTTTSEVADQAVGVLARATTTDAVPTGIFAGVTADGKLVLEAWTTATVAGESDSGAALVTRQLGTFDLSTLPPNQEHAAVKGWNMLRLRMRGGQASVWWNPTHADTAGPTRGLRLNASVPSMPLSLMTDRPSTGEETIAPGIVAGGDDLAAAVRGGASAKVDYIGVYVAI